MYFVRGNGLYDTFEGISRAIADGSWRKLRGVRWDIFKSRLTEEQREELAYQEFISCRE
jgi:hypothetical protein